MTTPRVLFCLLVAASSVLPSSTQGAEANPTTEPFDVVVYGGTSAGVIAAIQAKQMGKSAVVIEPGDHLGGLTSGGLGWTDSGRKNAIGGLSRQFYQRVKRHYDQPDAWKLETPEQYNRDRRAGHYEKQADAMWVFEPHVAEQIFDQMVREADVTVVKGERLNRASGVVIEKNRIRSIAMESGRIFKGRMFIDATYEGDLMAAAEVSFTVGREANATYGETLNGVQKAMNVKNHRFLVDVDPWVVPGDPSSGLMPGINRAPGEDGSADHRIQAYCFRMCMSYDAANRVPFPKPEDYDETRYELLFRNFEAGDLRLPMKLDTIPNHKTDTNNNGAVSTDNIGHNYDYPEASYAQRERIIADHESYQKGLMWTLANHPRVPQEIREKMKPWGLAADEFTDNDNWPHQLYIREARRMVSDYVTTELDCTRQRVTEDPVGMGSYNMDSHNCQRYLTTEGTVENEGDVQVSPGGPYLISYRSIVPRRGEAENLLVPVCVSSSHIAYGSIRMEPVFMILGQSAATAAALAIDKEVAVQQLPYAALRERLIADGQVLDLPPNVQPRKLISAESLPGIVVDDQRAEFEGAWVTSSSTPPYINQGYRHDDGASETHPNMTATFTATLPKAGRYDVRLAYPAHSNRSTQVQVTIHHAGGKEMRRVDQSTNTGGEHGFVSLGTYRFDEGAASVVISNAGSDGYVIADAVQWLPAEK